MLRNVLLYTMGLAVLSQANTLWSAETSAAETAPLIKCSPYLQAMDQNSVTVVWHTTRPSISWVNYQEKGVDEEPMTAISSTYGLKDIGLIQKITLKDLKPGTTYTYEINSKEVTKLEPYKFDFGAEENMKDKDGKTFTFTTWPEKADTFSFVMINDLHDDNAKHEKLLKATGADTAAFICYNGDIEPDKM
ncbi:MAG: fibronectin type III domain-containing protein, partial [Verrucomicrobia bacterium]|nr:fibronectin type III domain-containing protein [Verrucomicrobiota bacterium]